MAYVFTCVVLVLYFRQGAHGITIQKFRASETEMCEAHIENLESHNGVLKFRKINKNVFGYNKQILISEK